MQVFILEALALLALFLIFFVCRKKGVFSVISLGITVLIILQVLIPLILKGYDPIISTFVAGLIVACLIIYLTEGFTVASHISIGAVIISFVFISFLSWASVNLMRLSGLVSEESSYVMQYGVSMANLPQLLIAGIMIGTLGVLVEMVVTQVALVRELVKSNGKAAGLGQTQTHNAIFKKAYQLGVTHLGSMINTLFLIYAGVSLPLLIVIIGGQATLSNILHSQLIVADIVSTLVGVIGLIIAMPLSTALALWGFKRGS